MSQDYNCPECGCNEIEKRGGVMQWGRRIQRWQCAHCGRKFTLEAAEEQTECETVPYVRTLCPHCSSVKARVYSTSLPFRYHKCSNCGRNFRSVE